MLLMVTVSFPIATDRVTLCGCICAGHRKIYCSTVFAGQQVIIFEIKEIMTRFTNQKMKG